MLKKVFSIVFLPLLLSACVGSQFVVDDTDNRATFPDLHDVPERPVISERPQDMPTKEGLSKTYEESLSENERLRKEHGL